MPSWHLTAWLAKPKNVFEVIFMDLLCLNNMNVPSNAAALKNTGMIQ